MAEEKRFENRIKKFLEDEGTYFFKYWAGPFSRAGIPDIIASVNGVFFGIEVKATKGKPSRLQILNCSKINASGGVGIIVYPDDFEFLKEIVKAVMLCGTVTQTLRHTIDAHMRGFYATLKS